MQSCLLDERLHGSSYKSHFYLVFFNDEKEGLSQILSTHNRIKPELFSESCTCCIMFYTMCYSFVHFTKNVSLIMLFSSFFLTAFVCVRACVCVRWQTTHPERSKEKPARKRKKNPSGNPRLKSP